MVVGEFKRGKSMLVNALLGVEVLPTGVLPLTAVMTEVVRGVEGRCRRLGRREFRDGSRRVG